MRSNKLKKVRNFLIIMKLIPYDSGAPAEIFSGGGKGCFYYLLDRIKLDSCNQDFAKGLKPKAK